MIRLATETDSTYEPYCGGIPSPNPSYPQEIRNIGVYDEASGKYVVEVKCTGKNKLDCSGLVEQTKNGVTFTPVSDKNGLLEYIEVNGTASADIAYRVKDLPSLLTNEYIFSGCPSGGSSTTYRLQYSNVMDYTYVQYGNEVVIKKFDYEKYPNSRVEIYISKGFTANKLRFYPMIRPVGTDDTYEPYKETTATVHLDEPLRKGDKAYWNGGSKIRVDRNRAVKVFDGSSDELMGFDNLGITTRITAYYSLYTDEVSKDASQISYCDKLYRKDDYVGDYEHFYTSTKTVLFFINNDRLSAYNDVREYLASNPITVEYELATSITEEIDIDLDGLSMFYPTTILSNDCNANMEVTYIADTKAYIDKKFAELATAMV